MSNTETAGNMITRAQERADMENSNHISQAEWYRLLNVRIAQLWNHLVRIDPERYQREQTFTADGSTRDFSVASDYYGTLGVDRVIDSANGIYHPLPRLSGSDARRGSVLQAGVPRGYTFVYNNTTPSTELVRVIPVPQTGYDLVHRYTVAPQKFATDGTDSAELVHGIAGFEEYVVIGMAIDARIKEQSSVVPLKEEFQQIEAHLYEMAENRAAADAGTVVDSRATFDNLDPADWEYGG